MLESMFGPCQKAANILSVAGNDEFIIKTRNAPDQVRLKPGTQIEIGWMPEDCRALDA